MVSEATRPPFFELSASEEDYLRDIRFHLDFWQDKAVSELSRINLHQERGTLGVNLSTALLMLDEGKNHRKTKEIQRADSMHQTLDYIRKTRECIDSEQFIQAIRHCLKIPYFFLREDAYSGAGARWSAREGTSRGGRVTKRDDKLFEEFLLLRKEKPGKTVNAYAVMILSKWSGPDKKPSRTVVGRTIRQKLGEKSEK